MLRDGKQLLVAALEGAAVVGGFSALGAGLYSIGIPTKSIIQYESSIKAGKYMLVAHGSPDEVTRAESILSITHPGSTSLHLASDPIAAIA